MTALVSIRMDDDLFRALKAHADALHVSQTDYIRRAIAAMNKRLEKRERRQRLIRASMLCAKADMKINAEFSEIEYDSED